jgi:hypothetical protein
MKCNGCICEGVCSNLQKCRPTPVSRAAKPVNGLVDMGGLIVLVDKGGLDVRIAVSNRKSQANRDVITHTVDVSRGGIFL